MKGLSMVEIMIAMVILSTIIFATVSIVNQNQKIKAGVDEETALLHEVRAAVSMLESDVSQLFILPPRFSLKDRQEIQDALFSGEAQKFSGVTTNYQKRVAGQRDTHIKEIEYLLVKEDTGRGSEVAFSLFKKMTSFLDADLFGEGLNYEVLTDLKSLKFGYYDDHTKTWLESWDSRQGATRNRLPRAVSAAFEVYQRDPDNPDAEPKVINFETKFLADAWIETHRLFELSQSIQQAKSKLEKVSGKKPK